MMLADELHTVTNVCTYYSLGY